MLQTLHIIMTENSQELKKLCCTCLSVDRKLILLYRVDDGVNNLYLLLSSDMEAYREGFYKDQASLYICWECRAIMRRINQFRKQACMAQRKLTTILEGQTDVDTIQCLSTLASYHITTVQTMTLQEILMSPARDVDTFVDCGPEIDIDDVPLSELYSYPKCSQNEILESPPNSIELHMKDIKKKKIKTRKVKKKKDKYFTTIKISEDELMEHRQRCLNEDDFKDGYKCELCFESVKDISELEKHNGVFHTKKPDHKCCDICHTYIPKTSVEDHISSHYQKYSCRFCDYISYILSDVMKHLKNGHLKGIWSKGQRTAQVNSGSKSRRNRILTDKRTPNGFKCPECDKYFDNKNLRYKHIRRHHSEGFPCSVCGKRYPFKDNLVKHEKLHEGPLPREECPTCHKMIRVDLVRTHARIHLKRDTITCVECNKSYISRASYENHLKYSQAHASQDVLKYKCSMCDKGYRSKGELRDHVNYQHLGKTQHKCPVCGKALATRRCITRHVRRAHHDIKESPRDKICQQCGKAFRDKKSLREHEFIHTGERPLSCEICGCTFRQSASLYTHKKRVHKIYPQKKSVELVEPI